MTGVADVDRPMTGVAEGGSEPTATGLGVPI